MTIIFSRLSSVVAKRRSLICFITFAFNWRCFMATVMEENANPMKFEKLFKVSPEMIDENKHMNNVWAVQWVQDISIAHSDSVGATDVMYQLGCGWMIHTQFVEYKNQAFLNDEIRGTTWVASYSKVMSVRKCRFERVSDGKVVFESETQWVLMDMKRGRPFAIPQEIKDRFQVK